MKMLKCHNLSALREGRGWSLEPISSALLSRGSVKNVHLVSMQPGTVRGNHVHEKQVEWVIVFGGTCRVVADDGDGKREEMTVKPDDFVLFEITPGIAHSFKNVGKDVMYLLAFCDRPFSKDDPDRRTITLQE
jgi:dTDP-4-dehydrorhamnose 3,5-epimerase-like enzyme